MPEQMCSFDIKQPVRTIEINNLKIGGDRSFHFLTANSNVAKPVYALELDMSNFQKLEEYQKSSCDIIGLKFNIEENKFEIETAKNILKSLLPKISKPLMVRGTNNTEIDCELIPALIETLDRQAIIAFAEEKTYKKIVPPVIQGKHILVIRTPIDINLAKEMNILTTDMGLSPDKILIDTDMGGLGYGLEYGYSIMERIKLAGFEGDKMLNMPIIAFAGEETAKAKETKSNAFSQSWGLLEQRAIMFEIAAASAITAAGANIVVLNNPLSIETMKGLL